MGRLEDLASEYEKHICLPWQRTIAGGQRVILVVYEKELERTLRARLGEFEQRTRASGHGWAHHDCTGAFAEWMAGEEYREAYFEAPDDLRMKLEGEFQEYVVGPIRDLLRSVDENTVVAITGVASLYGFIRVSDLVRTLETDISGRLLVFFPGSMDGDSLRLLDARDGWNYLANIITLHGRAHAS